MTDLSKKVNIAWRKPREIDAKMLEEFNWEGLKTDLMVAANRSEWFSNRNQIEEAALNSDNVLQVLNEMEEAYNEMRLLYSIDNVSVVFTPMINMGKEYMYARSFFMVDGKRKGFNKMLGRTPYDTSKVDVEKLKSYFVAKVLQFKTK